MNLLFDLVFLNSPISTFKMQMHIENICIYQIYVFSTNIYTNITQTYMSSIHLLVTIYLSRMMYTYIIHSIVYIKFLRSLRSLGVVFAWDQAARGV